MAKITLRAYIREIEMMVEKGHMEEAIAHCQHVIQSFPKLIAAYRLLGKAYLEGQRYGDAADIFQRVLSAIPDDFMAHVGMSIIREDEANINSAIWHMERAFEAQPYNAAIQEELRRLYGKRDGLEPTKIRLTRGALARMYARGSLYQQAIAELRAALADDPHRPDLQVLLARMYFMAGQQVEAVDTCSSLIKKLPYCLEANRILAKILPETGRKEDSQAYSQRVNALDPYLLHASPASSTADEVPDNLVVTDKLEFVRTTHPGEITSQPEWAASLGVQVDNLSKKDQSLPDWLSGETEIAKAGEVPPFVEEPEEEANLIPDWMKQAGWRAGSSETEQAPTIEAPEPDEMEPASDEAAPGEIPDWLREMAPEGTGDEAEVEALSGEVPDWLQEMAPEDTPSLESFTREETSFSVEDLSTANKTEVPDWLKELAPDTVETIGLEGEPLQDFVVTGEEKFEALDESSLPLPIGLEEHQEEIPDWLQEQPAEVEYPQSEAEIPEWLKELAPEEIEATPEITEIAGEPSVEDLSTASVEAEAPDWLEEIGVEETEEILPTAPEASIEAAPEEDFLAGEKAAPLDAELPDWLQELTQAGPEETPPIDTEAEKFEWEMDELEPASEESVSILEPEQAVQEELPEWLKELSQEESVTPDVVAAPPVPDLSDTDTALAWLETLAVNQGAPEEELFTSPEERQSVASIPAETDVMLPEAEKQPGEPSEELPEWLKESIHETAEPAAEVPDVPDLTDPDVALAWLESLAARQGVPEEELITEPGERPIEQTVIAEDISIESVEAEFEEEAFKAPQALSAAGDFVEQVAEEIVPEIPPVYEELVELETEEELLDSFETPTATEVREELEVPEESLKVTEVLPEVEEVPEPEIFEEDFDVPESPSVAEEVEELIESLEINVEAEEIVEPLVEDKIFEIPEIPVVSEETSPPSDELPDWLKELVQEEEQAIGLPVEMEPLEAVEAIEEEEFMPRSTDEEQKAMEPLEDTDAALAWLEGLAARQGIPEEELVSKPEERPEETPDWLKELAESGDDQIEAFEKELDLVESPELSVEEVPEVEAAAEEELPSWIMDAATTPIQEEPWSESIDEFVTESEIAEEPMEKLDINSASLIELETLPGMGFIRAQNILAYRELHGEFSDLDELQGVQGFSPETIKDLKPLLKAVVTKPAPAPVVTPAPLPSDGSDQSYLSNARTLLGQGNLTEALEIYGRLIRKRFSLDDLIWDLKNAAAKSPEDSSLWQTLGDAYMRSDRLQEALEAYNQAEQLIR